MTSPHASTSASAFRAIPDQGSPPPDAAIVDPAIVDPAATQPGTPSETGTALFPGAPQPDAQSRGAQNPGVAQWVGVTGTRLNDVVGEYRDAVARLRREVQDAAHRAGVDAVGRVLTRRLVQPELAQLLAATPAGVSGSVGDLLAQLPAVAAAPDQLTRRVQGWLLTRIDVAWWGGARAYITDAELLDADELVDVEALRRRGLISFRYRRPVSGALSRLVRAARGHTATPPVGPTGVQVSRARPELVVLLNQLATDLAEQTRGGPAALWVASLSRSVTHQLRLRAHGRPANVPSAHCVGYAADVEMGWLKRFGADGALRALLHERQAAGQLNVVDQGQLWHLCLSPTAAPDLRSDFAAGVLTE